MNQQEIDSLPRFIQLYDESLTGLISQMNSLGFVFNVLHFEHDTQGYIVVLDRAATFVITKSELDFYHRKVIQAQTEHEATLKDLPLSA